MAFKRSDWNSIIDQVNALITSCGSAVAQLTEVPTDHIWSVADILVVRDALTQLCNSTFSADTVKWTQAIIDEINNAIANCQCGPTVFEVPTTTIDNLIGAGTTYQSIQRIYYIDPTKYQLAPALQRGETVTVTSDPSMGGRASVPTTGTSQSIATGR